MSNVNKSDRFLRYTFFLAITHPDKKIAYITATEEAAAAAMARVMELYSWVPSNLVFKSTERKR